MALAKPISLVVEKVRFINNIYCEADRWQNYDKALTVLKKKLPNHDLGSVLVKASAINLFYGLWIFDIFPPSKRVAEYYKENSGKVINYEHVDDFAKVDFGDDEKRNLKNLRSFASKYLHFFDENGMNIAIYDGFSGNALALHLGHGRTYYQDKEYRHFFEEIEKLRGSVKQDIGLKKLDRYLWVAGQYDVYWRHGRSKKKGEPEINREILKIFRNRERNPRGREELEYMLLIRRD